MQENRVETMAALPVKRMSRSAKGIVDRPGKRVKQKAGLNRSIQETGGLNR